MQSLKSRYTLATLSGAMASVAFLAPEHFYFAWVCFVPLLFALDSTKLKHAYSLGLIAGLTNFVSSTYWIADFIMLSKGYQSLPAYALASLYWLYSAQIFGILAILFRYLSRSTTISPLILFPIVLVVVFSTYPMLFPYRLADSQVEFTEILQAIELTGTYGLEALIALANVFVFYLLKLVSLNRSELKRATHVLSLSIPAALICLWYGYGSFLLSEWREAIAQWPTQTIGIVQPNETPSTERDKVAPGYMRGYPPEMEMSEQLAASGAELVVWPEARFKGVLNSSTVELAYQSNIDTLGVPLLFQDMHDVTHHDSAVAHKKRFNTAVLIRPNQPASSVDIKTDIQVDSHIDSQVENDNNNKTAPQHYQKMKLIPFGETFPFLQEEGPLSKRIRNFLGDFLDELNPGRKHTAFEVDDFNIIPLICYETVFPSFVAEALQTSPKNNKSNVIFALSSNGWFGSSHQPYQHVMPSILRAIETRTPIVHVVNNGPSIVATPAGDLSFVSDFQTAGGYLTELAYAPQKLSNSKELSNLKNQSNLKSDTFFSEHPNIFLFIFRDLLLILIISLILREWISKNKQSL